MLSLTGAGLIIVSTFSLGAFEKTHPLPSTSPDPSTRGGGLVAATEDGLGSYTALPSGERAEAVGTPLAPAEERAP